MRKWLKEIRGKYRLTADEMAAALEVDSDFYEVIESGKLQLNMPVLMAAKIADRFDVPLSRLILFEEEYKVTKLE